MSHEWREHTAEVELAIEADTQAEVFSEALDAFGRLVERERGGEPASFEVELEAPDDASLLVAWLEELIFFADTESFVPDTAADLEVASGRIRARLQGRRAELDPLVKAATYHGLELTRTDGRWRARVVLDV